MSAPVPAASERAGAERANADRWRRVAAFAVGLVLLASAAWVVARHGDVRDAWASVREAPAWLIATALVLPLANLAIVSLSFWVLMRRHGAISLLEMTCLIGAAWLLNYAPLRPGLVGRVAYHRIVNGIPVATSLGVTVVGLACAAAAVLAALGCALVLGAEAGAAEWAVALSVPAVGAGLLAVLLRAASGRTRTVRVGGAAIDFGWLLGVTFLLRYADVLIWVARYAVVFALIGSPIDLAGAVAMAGVSQLAMVIPIVGNGLGLREWGVGLMAGVLPGSVFAPSGSARAVGLTADLVNRAAELVLAIPVGIGCTLWLARRGGGRVRSGAGLNRTEPG